MNDDEMYEDLIKQFEEMLKTNENYFFEVEEFLDIIDEYISLGNYNMAGRAIKIALSQYEDNVDVLLYKAELYALKDQLEKAEEVIRELRAIDPERIEIPMLEAELYSRKHLHKRAIKALQDALQLAVRDQAEIYEMMTVEYMYLEDYRSALQTALEALKYAPDHTMALYNAVTCYDMLEQTDKAINFLHNFIKKEPFSEIAWSLLGKKYIDTEQYQKAIDALDYAIAIDDHFLGAYYDKAFAYTRLGDYNQAIEFYKLTLGISDPTAFTYYHIAKNYERLENYLQAVKYYLLAVDEDPGYYKSWIKLIKLKIKLQDYDRAMDLTIKALNITRNQELFELLGDIHQLKNKFHKAIHAYKSSMMFGATKLSAVLKLAELYKQTGQISNLRQLLLEAKQKFPDSKEIISLMQGK